MLLENYYYYYINVIPHNVCDDIIKFASQHQEVLGATGNIKEKDLQEDNHLVEENKKHRNSYITWLDEQWIYNEIQPFIQEANINAKWNFEWDWTEPAQFTRYKLNQYYNWHVDQDIEPDDNGKIRKLSCTVQLSHPEEYEGGDLQFQTPHGEFTANEIKPKGSICVFPSFVTHRVTPVTSGIRQSLVMWNRGKPFR